MSGLGPHSAARKTHASSTTLRDAIPARACGRPPFQAVPAAHLPVPRAKAGPRSASLVRDKSSARSPEPTEPHDRLRQSERRTCTPCRAADDGSAAFALAGSLRIEVAPAYGEVEVSSPVAAQQREQPRRARPSASVPSKSAVQHVGQPRQASAVTGRSASEIGPTAASRTTARTAARRPAAPLKRCSWTEPLVRGERRVVAGCNSHLVAISF